ncbi:MAG: Phosphopentomutase [Firmicutes bacterium ADurb.Bin153]|nr:MAG: Phosphopentomutase [Firmicutes bacterium ADurb.Bin153]HPU95656.1 phosphopentomutase [Bacillota bacterium]
MGAAKRAIILVLDGIGAGEMPDAGLYGDEGSNTLANTASKAGGLTMPTLSSMGLGNAVALSGKKAPGLDPAERPTASWGRMMEKSPGKDSTTGHWEMAGVVLKRAFPLYPEGFPDDVLDAFSSATGRGVLCNRPYSGTEVIKDFGDEHVRTGRFIVYTSGDSVFQIASHVDVVPLEELYEASRAARRILTGEHEVGRVIARPFKGGSGSYARIGEKRRDFAVEPPVPNLLSLVVDSGMDVTGCGKIDDLFANRNISVSRHVSGNRATMEALVQSLGEDRPGLVFANCVDFDMLYGHRNDIRGMASALEEVDGLIAGAMERMGADDLLIVTADHGNDPTTPSTDHSREMPFVLVWGKGHKPVPLGTRSTFADVGATAADWLGLRWDLPGTSMIGAERRALG